VSENVFKFKGSTYFSNFDVPCSLLNMDMLVRAFFSNPFQRRLGCRSGRAFILRMLEAVTEA
jgi:hypothetical protein